MTYEGYNKGYKGVQLRKRIRKSFLSDKLLNADYQGQYLNGRERESGPRTGNDIQKGPQTWRCFWSVLFRESSGGNW